MKLKKTKKLSRRDFLKWAVTGLAASQGYDIFKHGKQKRTEKAIYGLDDYVRMAKHVGTYEDGERDTMGAGIFVDDFYISCSHIPNSLFYRRIQTPFGIMKTPAEPKKIISSIGDIKLEERVNNKETDIYVAKPNQAVVNFPCKPSRDFNYGDKVYLIGNPDLAGANIRKGYISDLDGYDDSMGKSEDAFGVDFPLHGGDSGTPLVNENFELLGLAHYVMNNKFGYITKIGLYLDAIKDTSKME